jgi:predicted RNA binding protein YcfA (HicA-like mRNA interferase family)
MLGTDESERGALDAEDRWLAPRGDKGSHRQFQFKHPTKSGRVTVPGKPGDHLAPGTLNSILKQAGLK